MDMKSNLLDAEQREERQTKRSLFAGIAIWFVAANVVYALPSLACKWGWFPFKVGSLSGLQAVQLVVNTVALTLMAVMVYLPARDWRRFQSQQPPHNPDMLQDTEKGREPLLAFIVFMLNVFFLLIVIALYAPIFTLKACA